MSLHPATLEMSEAFSATCHQTQEALTLNPHSLSLLMNETGYGRKLLMKYDGPFEIIQNLSAVSY